MNLIKDKDFKEQNLTYGKNDPRELVIFKNCVFNNTRIYSYSGKMKFYSCRFENNSKIVEVNLDTSKDTSNNYIDLTEITTRSIGQNLEINGANINITRPVGTLKGLIISGNKVIFNLNSKEIDTVSIKYKDKLCVNDALLVNAQLENIDNKAEESFSNCYINNDFYPFEMITIKEKKFV
jgi:hypothetical protein